MNPKIEFLLNKSIEFLRGSNLESAELLLRQAIRVEPGNPHTLRLLGIISFQRGLYFEALDYFNKSLKIFPRNPLALSNLGNAFLKLKQYENALDSYDRAIKFDPKYEEAWSNKAVALKELLRFEEAITHYDQALHLRPNYPEALTNKGISLHELKQFDEAISCYDQALSLKPDHHEAFWGKSLSLLLQGNFDEGLPLYESRWNSTIVGAIAGKRSFNKPNWTGVESLHGKKIFIYGEQGLGDFIQFCVLTKALSDLGAQVILEVPQTLFGLMKSLDGVTQLVVKGENIPPHDFCCPLLSLPLALKINMSSLPLGVSYLAGDPKKVEVWKDRLGVTKKTRVGLVWSSSSGFKDDHKRSLSLEKFITALPHEGYEYICLQKEIKECDAEFLDAHKNIQFFGEELNDFSDTAALIECVDLVISTCTSVPHLSAAMGKKTWVCLSFTPDWRWFLGREDSPWYPSVRLYRQSAIGSWDAPLAKINNDLSVGL